jgi:hypothetical protein
MGRIRNLRMGWPVDHLLRMFTEGLREVKSQGSKQERRRGECRTGGISEDNPMSGFVRLL